MIKKLIILAALTLMAVSCANEMDNAQKLQVRTNGEGTTLYATVEGGEEALTKVYADADLHVLWNADDRISVFNWNTFNDQFQFKGEDGANAGTFSLIPSQDLHTGSDLNAIYAAYPYRADAKITSDGSVMTLEIPAAQSYRAGSFGIGANTMAARSTSSQLSFRNVGSYLCFKLYGEGVSVQSVTLKGNAGETLAGPVSVSFDSNGLPAMAFDNSNPSALGKQITLDAATPVALGATEQNAVAFWMVVPTVTLSSGFTVTVTDSKGGVHEKTLSKSITFGRNRIQRMKAFELQPSAQDVEGWYYQGNPVFLYDKTNAQINILEAEGSAWLRILSFSSLSMMEVGPVPVNAVAGDSFDAIIMTFYEGHKEEIGLRLTVQSIEGGKIDLLSTEGHRFVFRF